MIILSGFWYNANASCLNLTLDTSAKKSFHKIDTNKLKLYCKLLCLVDGGVLFSNRFATNNQIDLRQLNDLSIKFLSYHGKGFDQFIFLSFSNPLLIPAPTLFIAIYSPLDDTYGTTYKLNGFGVNEFAEFKKRNYLESSHYFSKKETKKYFKSKKYFRKNFSIEGLSF